MSLFVRCNWLPPRDATLLDRFSEVRRPMTTNALLAKLGPRWFQLGRSRKDALKREVRLEEFDPKQKGCERVTLGTSGKSYWSLSVWNGGPDGETAGLRVTIREPSSEVDQIVISAELDFLQRTMAWTDILGAARHLSEQLGGYTIVSSDDLIDEGKRRGIVYDSPAAYAYAAFWGVDRSGRNPKYRWLATTRRTAPFEIVACDSWAEVSAPDNARLREITESLTGVEAEAGGGTTA